MYFDVHCHLNEDSLFTNVDQYIKNAISAKVKYMLVAGWDVASSKRAVQLAKQYKEVYAAVGIHPSNIKEMSCGDIDAISKLAQEEKVVAIGEIGLDYHWEKDPTEKEKQKKFFVEQINLANKLKLPIIVHNRDADQNTLEVLKKHKPIYGGVMHCYSAGPGLLNDFLEIGMFISLGGPVTFLNAKTPKEVAEDVSLDRLLIETDSPYLAPHPFRGTKNEPSYIYLVAKKIAEIKKTSVKNVAERTMQNACELFHVKTYE